MAQKAQDIFSLKVLILYTCMLRLNQIVLFKKMQKSTLTERVILQRTPSCISDLTLRTPNQERDINYPAKEQDEREIMIDVSNSRRWHL